MKPLKTNAAATDENKYNEKLEAVKPTAVRHLILIRHGQYNLDGATDTERYLTETGRKQAAFTGDRLNVLKIPLDLMVRSTMTRAQETGKIISTHITNIPIENCSLIEEGAPIAPQPPIGHWHPEPHVSIKLLLWLLFFVECCCNFIASYASIFNLQQFFQDGARIEAAFRKYFHRADAKQEKDSYTLLVCHANVIRYFVCR